MIQGGKGPFPYHEGRHLIVPVRNYVYADESGTHQAARFCVVAGYRGTPGQWKVFNREWRSVLGKPHYRVPDFHSRVFFNRRSIPATKPNPYQGWSDAKANRFLGELLYVIRHRRLVPVGCAVNIEDFESYTYGERCSLVGYVTRASRRTVRERPQPYHGAARYLMTDSIDGVAPDTEMHFVLAEHDEYQAQAYNAYLLGKKYDETGNAHRMRSFSFEPAAAQPGLQVADLLAHQWYNYLTRGRGRLNRQNVDAMNQLTYRRRVMPIMDRPNIEAWFESLGITAAGRAALRSFKEPRERSADGDAGLGGLIRS